MTTTINYEGGVVITTSANNDITFTPNGSGDVNLGGNFTLPTADGTNGQVLQTDGSGTVTFETIVQATGNELENIVEDTTPQLGGQLDINGNSIGDGTLELLSFIETGSAINELTITNAAAGNAPALTATGGDTNVDLTLDGKGTGTVKTLSSNLDITGNIVVSGTVDGIDIATDVAANTAKTGVTTEISNVVEDTTPQLGGSLDVNGNSIVSVSDGDIAITPDGTGDVVLDGLNWPQADGTNGQVVTTNGSGQLSFSANGTGINNVIEDTTPQLGGQLDVNGNSIGDGTLELLSFSETASAVNELTITNAATGNAPSLTATGGDSDIDLILDGKGTGTVKTLSSNLDITGNIVVSGTVDGIDIATDVAANTAKTGVTTEISNVVEDTTPQLGGDLDVNGQSIVSASNGNVEIFPNGTGAVDIATQEIVHDAGNFSSDGDARSGQYVLRAQTTDATVTELFIDGSSVRLDLPNDSVWGFNIMIVARRTDANDESAIYKFDGAIDRNATAATTALVGAGGTKTVIDEDTAAWDTAISADTTNGSLKIDVTGEAAKNINWFAFVRTVEITG